MKEDYGIYVHIPFCKARCGYCAFSSCVNFKLQKPYFDVLCKEIERTDADGIVAKTMFWGGGTPSAVSINYLEQLYAALSAKFDLSALTEFTVECNPESATRELLCFLKGIGVNRLSFGLQSVCDDTLKRIGRLHSYADFLLALRLAEECGFENINADVIVGLPEKRADFENTVKTVVGLPLSHVSLYALEIHDENKKFKRLCQSYGYTEDDLADMYDFARIELQNNGFLRYEVSNFAKENRECIHNLVYWTENRYFGFGAAASGFVKNLRYGNVFDVKDYMQSGGAKRDYEEVISLDEEAYEYVMLGLRLQRGIDLHDFERRFGRGFTEVFPNAVKLEGDGFLAFEDGRVFLPDEKFYVLNSVLTELLSD